MTVLSPKYIYDRLSSPYQRMISRSYLNSTASHRLIFYLIKNGYTFQEVDELFSDKKIDSERNIDEDSFYTMEETYFRERHIIDLLIDYLAFQIEKKKLILNARESLNNTDSLVFLCILSKFKFAGKAKAYCPIRDIELFTGYSKKRICASLHRLRDNEFIFLADKRDPDVKTVPRNLYKIGKKLKQGIFDLYTLSNIYNYSIHDIDNDSVIRLYKIQYISNGDVIDYDNPTIKYRNITKDSKNNLYNHLMELIAFKDIPYRLTLKSIIDKGDGISEKRINKIWKERASYWNEIERYQIEQNTDTTSQDDI